MIRVSRLSFTPVRSLGLSHPESIELTEMGLVQDRRFYLVDERGRLVDRLIDAQLVQVRAVDLEQLRATVGSLADWLLQLSHGDDPRPVVPDRASKSSSTENT